MTDSEVLTTTRDEGGTVPLAAKVCLLFEKHAGSFALLALIIRVPIGVTFYQSAGEVQRENSYWPIDENTGR